jgi:hypothetical protein
MARMQRRCGILAPAGPAVVPLADKLTHVPQVYTGASQSSFVSGIVHEIIARRGMLESLATCSLVSLAGCLDALV